MKKYSLPPEVELLFSHSGFVWLFCPIAAFLREGLPAHVLPALFLIQVLAGLVRVHLSGASSRFIGLPDLQISKNFLNLVIPEVVDVKPESLRLHAFEHVKNDLKWMFGT